MFTFQEIILTLQRYWNNQGCVLLQPYDMEVGAGTFHTATFLRALGPEPWKAAYVQPSRRPKAALIGAHVSFELSRRCGRPLVARFLRDETLDRADRLVLASGALGLLLLRLTPVVAFTALNWAAGLTTLRRWTFLWTTAVGILPGAILFTVSGSGVAALSSRHPALGVALLAFLIGLAVLIHARIRRSSRSAAAAAEPPSGEL